MTLIDWILLSLFAFVLFAAGFFFGFMARMREDEIELLARNSERPAPIERDK